MKKRRSLRGQPFQGSPRRKVFAPKVRASRFELLEARQMLTATVDTIHSFDIPQYSGNSGVTVDGSQVFGTTTRGGADGYGVVYSVNEDGTDFQILHTFTGAAGDGAYAEGNLTLVGSTLYGVTGGGGANGGSGGNGPGTIFSINTDGTDYQILHSFSFATSDGAQPAAGLTLSGTTLYGTTQSGGDSEGTIFAINLNGSDYHTIYSFNDYFQNDGFWPASPLIIDGSKIYGTTGDGGANYSGTLFSVNTDGSDFQDLYSFNPSAGSAGGDLSLIGSTLYGTNDITGGGAFFSINTDGTNYQTLYSFNYNSAWGPTGSLTLIGSTFYGVTQSGGSNGAGAIFTINPDGSNFHVVYSLSGGVGSVSGPNSGLTIDGTNLLDVGQAGGQFGDGGVFAVSGLMPEVAVCPSGGAPVYALGGPAVPLDPGLKISSSAADLISATVTISPGTLQPGDLLGFTNQNGITGNYSGGVLTLTGSATPAQYQAALQSVTFSAIGLIPTTRSISIVASDSDATSAPAPEQMTIAVAAINPSRTTNTFHIGGSPVPVDSTATIFYSKGTLTGLTLTISPGSYQPGDVLNFTSQNNITGTYADGLLTLTGDDTVADYQAALQSVTFSTSNVASTPRSISLVALDGALTSNAALETVDVHVAPPVVTPSGLTNTFTIGGQPVVIDSGLTVGFAGTMLTGANVYDSPYGGLGDTLNFTNQNGITGFYSDGNLTLTGTATVAQYQAALRSITFSSTAPYLATRSISFDVSDDQVVSNSAVASVAVFGPPVVDSGSTQATYTISGPAVTVQPYLSIEASDANLSGATIAISPATLLPGDMLNFVNQNGITGNYAGGVLTLTGSASVDNYETALASITFSTTSNTPGTRLISMAADDGALIGGPTSENVAVVFPAAVLSMPFQETQFTGYPTSVQPSSGFTAVGSALFGTSTTGGTYGDGEIFFINDDGSNATTVHSFQAEAGEGTKPISSLVLVGSTLYGTTSAGGAYGDGTIFSINTDGTGFKTLYSFGASKTDGQDPTTGLTLDGTTLFGTTSTGGTANLGTLFSISTTGTGYQLIHSFGATAGDALMPYVPLTAVGSTLYGTTGSGGAAYEGAIYSFNANGTGYQVLHSFGLGGDLGGGANSSLVLVGSTLYGTTSSGGASQDGSIYSINLDGSGYQVQKSFSQNLGLSGNLTAVGSFLYGETSWDGNQNSGSVFAFDTADDSFRTVQAFSQNDSFTYGPWGENPTGGLTLVGSTLYGITGEFNQFGPMFSLSNIAAYNLGGPAAAFQQGLTLTVTPDSTELAGATVTISPATLQSGDVLNFVNQNGITGTYAGGVLTLTGNATAAQYQAALQSVTFSTSSTSTTDRSMSTVTTDANFPQSSNPLTVEVAIGAPIATPSGTTGTFTVGGPATAIDPGLALSSPDGELTGATVSIAGQSLQYNGTYMPGDVLHFTNQNGITGTYANGLLVLTGTATVAQYQTALQSVTFSTTAVNPVNNTVRSIVISAIDGSAISDPAIETLDLIGPPSVTVSGTQYTYRSGSTAWVPVAGVTISAFDQNLSGATVSISPGTYQAGDILADSDDYGITSSYANGVLTLTGAASVADYEQVLSSVTFNTTSLVSGTRSISFVVADGAMVSTPATAVISVDVPPILTASGISNKVINGGPPVALDAGITLVSGDATISSVTISPYYSYPGVIEYFSPSGQSGYTLNFVNQNGITGSFSNGVLTLTGNATAAQYQAALRSITFAATNSVLGTQSLSIVAVDSDGDSSAYLTESVNVVDPVMITGSGNSTFTFGGADVAIDSGLTVTSIDGNITGATITIAAGQLQPGDTLNFVNQNGITGTYFDGVLTLIGNATAAHYQTALQSITFSTTSTVLGARSFTVSAMDGSQSANSVTECISVVSPIVVTPGTPGSYMVGAPPVAINPGLTITGSPDGLLTGATITDLYMPPGDVLNFTNQNGIAGTWAGGVLTLTGTATVAQYQAALQSITFSATTALSYGPIWSVLTQPGNATFGAASAATTSLLPPTGIVGLPIGVIVSPITFPIGIFGQLGSYTRQFSIVVSDGALDSNAVNETINTSTPQFHFPTGPIGPMPIHNPNPSPLPIWPIWHEPIIIILPPYFPIEPIQGPIFVFPFEPLPGPAPGPPQFSYEPVTGSLGPMPAVRTEPGLTPSVTSAGLAVQETPAQISSQAAGSQVNIVSNTVTSPVSSVIASNAVATATTLASTATSALSLGDDAPALEQFAATDEVLSDFDLADLYV